MSERVSKELSEEFDETQQRLAQEEGDAYQRSVAHMIESVAETGAMKEAGEFIVGFAQEEAEGLYQRTGDGEFDWIEPANENCHIEVVVADAADGRFVPELDVRVTLRHEDGEEVGPVELPFLWHPGLYHYGENVEIPGDGTYTLDVHVDPPEFRRHDEKNGDRYGEHVDVTFSDVTLKTGRS